MRNTSRARSARGIRPGVWLAWTVTGLVLIAIVVFSVLPTSAKEAGNTHTISIEGMRFLPSTVRIAPGDRVVFENNDLVPHTATSKPTGLFDSGVVEAGKSWTFVAHTAGTIRYGCTLHPTMEAEIVVVKQ